MDYDIDTNIFIAILGGFINMILTLIIPCLLKKTKEPLLTNINKFYTNNKQLIITSSIIVAITIYIALSLTPSVNNMLSSITENNESKCVSFVRLSNLSNHPNTIIKSYSINDSSSSL